MTVRVFGEAQRRLGGEVVFVRWSSERESFQITGQTLADGLIGQATFAVVDTDAKGFPVGPVRSIDKPLPDMSPDQLWNEWTGEASSREECFRQAYPLFQYLSKTVNSNDL